MITLTDGAKQQILLAMDEEERDDLALRIAIVGKRAGGFQYQMDLVAPEEQREGDELVELDGLRVLIDPRSAPDLKGATVDFVHKLAESGFKFDNPNSAWADPQAVEVQRVIDDQINPQVASHGGYVTLLEVKEDTAFISLGGGCQGCGMADVTLKQGIEVMIKEAVPSIQRVLDTTDHAAGTNPYYAGSAP